MVITSDVVVYDENHNVHRYEKSGFTITGEIGFETLNVFAQGGCTFNLTAVFPHGRWSHVERVATREPVDPNPSTADPVAEMDEMIDKAYDDNDRYNEQRKQFIKVLDDIVSEAEWIYPKADYRDDNENPDNAYYSGCTDVLNVIQKHVKRFKDGSCE